MRSCIFGERRARRRALPAKTVEYFRNNANRSLTVSGCTPSSLATNHSPASSALTQRATHTAISRIISLYLMELRIITRKHAVRCSEDIFIWHKQLKLNMADANCGIFKISQKQFKLFKYNFLGITGN